MADLRQEAHERFVAAAPAAPAAFAPVDPSQVQRGVAQFVGIMQGDDYGADPNAPAPQGMPGQAPAPTEVPTPTAGAALRDAGLGHSPPQQTTGGDTIWSGSFAHDLLASLNMPITFENLRAIQAWMKAETGSQGKGTPAFNPLATTQNYGSNTKFNSVGVRNYADYDTGIKATAQVMMNGHYAPILAALARGTNAMDVARAVAETPWGTGTGVERVLGAK